jgi:cytochrome c biogenesis protein CcmG, thiol:disulfide interchange protein DsbE
MRRINIIAGAALALLAAQTTAREPVVGKPAPPVELTLVDGTKVSLADLKGQVVVINFWATWCGPCKRELPLLDAVYRKLQPNGLRVFAVTTEDSLPLFQLKKLFADMAIPSVRHIHGMSDEMPAVPTNYVIDRAGVVRYAKAGAFDLDAVNRELVPLLNERPPA